MITQAELKELFHYDGENLIWKKRGSGVTVGFVAGGISELGYRRIRVKRKKYMAHRLIWMYFNGSFPSGEIDHVDGDKLNNRIENLRDVSRSIQAKNTKKREDNLSGVNGVSWNKACSKWQAYINVDKRRIDLGYYADKAKAAARRRMAEVIYGGFTERHGA